MEMVKVMWQACWPAALYGLMIDAASILCGSRGTLMGTLAGALPAVPVFAWLYGRMPGRPFDTGQGKAAAGGNTAGGWEKFGVRDAIFCAVIGIGACAAVNTLIMLSPLPRYFTGFSRTAERLYGPSLLVQAGAMGAVVPVAEELVFRGLVFGGLRRRYPFGLSACLSAAVFGIYHGNVLQAVYGGVMGWVLAWGMERKGTVRAPVVMHMAANLTSVILTAAG